MQFFVLVKYVLLHEFFIQYFSGEYIWSSICIYQGQNFSFIIWIEQQHENVIKLIWEMYEYLAMKVK